MTTINEQMAAWGRRGGQSRSEKKREAARKNVAAARAKIGQQQPPAPEQPAEQPRRVPPARIFFTPRKEAQ